MNFTNLTINWTLIFKRVSLVFWGLCGLLVVITAITLFISNPGFGHFLWLLLVPVTMLMHRWTCWLIEVFI